MIELEVLIDAQLRIPSAKLASQRYWVGAKRNVIYDLYFGTVVICGVSDAERGCHRDCDRPTRRTFSDPVFSAADSTPVVLPKVTITCETYPGGM